jgi:hypothetical protein
MKYFAELDNSNNVIRVCVFNDSVQNEEEAATYNTIIKWS